MQFVLPGCPAYTQTAKLHARTNTCCKQIRPLCSIWADAKQANLVGLQHVGRVPSSGRVRASPWQGSPADITCAQLHDPGIPKLRLLPSSSHEKHLSQGHQLVLELKE